MSAFPIGVMRRVRDQEFVDRAKELCDIYYGWTTLMWYTMPDEERERWYRVQEECDERVRKAIDTLTGGGT